MSSVDYYDVQSMIRDARSEIRGEIESAAREVREQVWVELSNLQREIEDDGSCLSLRQHEPRPERKKRLTLTDAYRDAQHVIDQLTTRAPAEPSASVEITRNAAGNAQFTVKTYATASADQSEVDAAMERAFNVASSAYDSLHTLYPHVDPKAAK